MSVQILPRFIDAVRATSEVGLIAETHLRGRSMQRRRSYWRQVLIYVAIEHCEWSMHRVGGELDRDHTTIRYAYLRIESMMFTDQRCRMDVSQVVMRANRYSERARMSLASSLQYQNSQQLMQGQAV
jgi:hypothetical protein